MSSPNDPSHEQAAPGFSLSLNDVYFILFRHKWKIVICAILGLVAAITFKKMGKDTFISEAKIFVRYVQEDRAPTDLQGGVAQFNTPGARGSTVMDSEIAILNSFDLVEEVAKTIGVNQILGPIDEAEEYSDAELLLKASSIIRKNLLVGTGRNSSIISLAFTNQDPAIVQPLLNEVITQYLTRHNQIHRTLGKFDDELTKTTDQLKAKLTATEEELERVKEQAGIISIESSKTILNEQLANIQDSLFTAQSQLAEKRALINNQQLPPAATDESSNESSGDSTLTTSPAIQEYEGILNKITALRNRESLLSAQFTSENPLLKSINNQIQEVELRKTQLESENPILVENLAENGLTTGDPTNIPQVFNLQTEKHAVSILESRIKFLQQQKELIRSEAFALNNTAVTINELERKRALQDQNYRNFATKLEQTRIDAILGSNDVSGISIIQKPTPPLTTDGKELQIAAGLAAAGFIFGLAWAALIELLLDQKIRRPKQIETEVGVPLFLSIPDSKQASFRKIAKSKNYKDKRQLTASKAARTKEKKQFTPTSPTLVAAAKSKPNEYGANSLANQVQPELSSFDESQELKPYYEALRDRMIGYFESRNMTHSPKLIGLTGLGESPGVTTTASGLATCLSETGEGNVLLIDMTLGQESAQQFYNGTQVWNLDDALESKNASEKSDKLFVVAEGSNGYKVPSILPNRLNHIVPKLKASDFDYIIFDMPEVSHISPTPRMAGFMDAMLLVIEADATNKASATHAVELLKKSNSHIGAILNKTKKYLPNALESDFTSNS